MNLKELVLWVVWGLCVFVPAGLLASPFWEGRVELTIASIVIALVGLWILSHGRDRIRAFLAVAGFTGIIGLGRISLEVIRGLQETGNFSLAIQGIAYAVSTAVGFFGIARLSRRRDSGNGSGNGSARSPTGP